jgi:hypothetical protein
MRGRKRQIHSKKKGEKKRRERKHAIETVGAFLHVAALLTVSWQLSYGYSMGIL